MEDSYPNKFNKMTDEDRMFLFNTWAASFEKFSDEALIVACRSAVKKSPFFPSVSEMHQYLKRAESVIAARIFDDQHRIKDLYVRARMTDEYKERLAYFTSFSQKRDLAECRQEIEDDCKQAAEMLAGRFELRG